MAGFFYYGFNVESDNSAIQARYIDASQLKVSSSPGIVSAARKSLQFKKDVLQNAPQELDSRQLALLNEQQEQCFNNLESLYSNLTKENITL